jgi:hypothetical protein
MKKTYISLLNMQIPQENIVSISGFEIHHLISSIPVFCPGTWQRKFTQIREKENNMKFNPTEKEPQVLSI